MNYGKAEERSSSRHPSPSTARHAATSAILTDILSRSDRAPTSSTVDARPGKSNLALTAELSAVQDERTGEPFSPSPLCASKLDRPGLAKEQHSRSCRAPDGRIKLSGWHPP